MLFKMCGIFSLCPQIGSVTAEKPRSSYAQETHAEEQNEIKKYINKLEGKCIKGYQHVNSRCCRLIVKKYGTVFCPVLLN